MDDEPIVLVDDTVMVMPTNRPDSDGWTLQIRVGRNAILTLGEFPDALTAVGYFDHIDAEMQALAAFFGTGDPWGR